MDSPNSPDQENKATSETQRRLSLEDWLLLTGVGCFVIFIWIAGLIFIPHLSRRSGPAVLPPAIVKIAATRGFVLPPTWTPAPTQEFIPTPSATGVYDGRAPTRIYTPRPTSLPGLPITFPLGIRPTNRDILDLARIMQGESPGDKDAAYYVGWVAKNRLLHVGYGDNFAVVSNGFFGYRESIQPSHDFLEISVRIMRSRKDPTDGCLYAFSRTDITNLRIPPQRADVTKGEWFFFRTWPLPAGL